MGFASGVEMKWVKMERERMLMTGMGSVGGLYCILHGFAIAERKLVRFERNSNTINIATASGLPMSELPNERSTVHRTQSRAPCQLLLSKLS